MDDDFFKNKFRGFGNPYNNGHQNPNDLFDSFFHHDVNLMFREMEEMMNQIGFQNIEFIQNPNEDRMQPQLPKRNGNLRDMFLKSPEETNASDSPPVQTSLHRPSLFETLFFGPRPIVNPDFEDSNKPKDLDKYFRHDLVGQEPRPELSRPTIITSGQSCSIRRIQRPDGSIEEVKTIRNSDGKEEKVVTRIIGDKVHSVIEKKSDKGLEETEEIFQNFDEDKLNEFNRMWENFPTNKKREQEPNQLVKTDNQSQPSGFISKLFSWLK